MPRSNIQSRRLLAPRVKAAMARMVYLEKNAEALAPETQSAVRQALQAGGLIVFPTETFYGLATLPFSNSAVEGLYRAKGRPVDKATPVIAASSLAAVEAISLGARLQMLAAAFWPGPLTIVAPLSATHRKQKLLAAPDNTLGVRVSSLPLARALAASAGGLITSTSANLSGQPPVSRVEELDPTLVAHVDLILDAGPTPGGAPSTVVTADAEGRLNILRAGAVAPDEVGQIWTEVGRGQR